MCGIFLQTLFRFIIILPKSIYFCRLKAKLETISLKISWIRTCCILWKSIKVDWVKEGEKLNATIKLLNHRSHWWQTEKKWWQYAVVCEMGEFHKTRQKMKQKEKHLISHQTRQDMVSLILGFKELCAYKLHSSHASIIPSRVNSDVIENTFCQQRTLHIGANTNSTYLGYCHSLNAVILEKSLY